MNRCHFLKEISSYLDNQLSENKKIKLEAHLKECRVCAQELNQLKNLSEKLKQWHLPLLEPYFDSSVKNKIVAWELQGGRVKMKKKTLSILIPSGAIAGILLVSLLSFQMYVKRGVSGRFSGGSEDGFGEPYNVDSVYGRLAYSNRADEKNANKEEKLKRGYGEREKRKQRLVMDNIEPLLPAAEDKVPMGIRKLGSLEEMPGGDISGLMSTIERTSAQAEDSRVIVIQPTLPATGAGEMIIRSAELTLEVENGKETYRKIADICREFGGYQAESNFSKNDQGREAGRVTLRIPKDKFLAVLDKLSELGKVKANDTYSQDVSQEYANLKSQLEAAKIVYEKMLEALKKRQTTIPEAIRLESELTPVLRKIEELKNQIEKLNNLTSFTTITVNFYEAEVSAKVLEESKKLVKEGMLAAKINAVRYFAKNLPFLGFGLVLGVVVIVAIASVLSWLKQLIKR